jgi:uncharacterized lipoprotein
MRTMFRRLALALPLLLLVACSSASTHPKVDMREEYGRAVRWSEWDLAWQFIDPTQRKSLVLPGEEQDRLKDVQVTAYNVRNAEPQPDGTIKQLVEVHYIDKATQIEKTARVNEVWRTDDNGEHWWLTTGLPEF